MGSEVAGAAAPPFSEGAVGLKITPDKLMMTRAITSQAVLFTWASRELFDKSLTPFLSEVQEALGSAFANQDRNLFFYFSKKWNSSSFSSADTSN